MVWRRERNVFGWLGRGLDDEGGKEIEERFVSVRARWGWLGRMPVPGSVVLEGMGYMMAGSGW